MRKYLVDKYGPPDMANTTVGDVSVFLEACCLLSTAPRRGRRQASSPRQAWWVVHLERGLLYA